LVTLTWKSNGTILLGVKASEPDMDVIIPVLNGKPSIGHVTNGELAQKSIVNKY